MHAIIWYDHSLDDFVRAILAGEGLDAGSMAYGDAGGTILHYK